ncbi:MAG: hypothetical protein A3F68_09350 [Acidobacteria bacterium RIFCSPLOWO2_12_FULL_54_10]|nr:MAG: hypothetical protein A3F68_09350 [Acidobacteria bacterium RIFCSPLOWO2_12_FULL_54_10]
MPISTLDDRRKTHWAWRPVRQTRMRWGRWLADRPTYPRLPEFSNLDIFLSGNSEQGDGLRAAQLSDVHHGLFVSLREVEHAVELINYKSPDLVLLTGDFVTRSWVHIEPVAKALGKLQANLGVFAVLGNHDHRTDAGSIEHQLTGNGIQVLRNRHVVLQRERGGIGLAGVDDVWYSCDLAKALKGMPQDIPRILLCHNPSIFLEAVREGIDFVASGHTHGGQVRVPGLNAMYNRPFRSGLQRLSKTQIYVSRGIGRVVLPVRLGCPPEIPIFHLRSSSGDINYTHASG